MKQTNTLVALLLLCLTFALPSCAHAADPSSVSGLDLWLRADTGITVASGRVSAWADQSGAGNNAAQATAANQPAYTGGIDPSVSFEGVNNQTGTSPAAWMTTGALPSINQQAFSAFMVIERAGNFYPTYASFSTTQVLLGSASNALTALHLHGNKLCYLAAAEGLSSLTVPSTRVIIGIVSSGTGVTLYENGQAVSMTAYAAATTTGLQIGQYNSVATNYGKADVKCVLHYSRTLTSSDINAVTDYLSTTYNVPLQPSYNVVCDGDSITYGYNSTINQSWPRMLGRLLGNDFQVYNIGVPSEQIGTLAMTGSQVGVNGCMAANAAANVDALIQAGKTNVLIVFGGTNDIVSSIGNQTGAAAYTRLMTYLAARRTAGWTKIVVVTSLPRPSGASSGSGAGLDETDRLTFNSSIRSGALASCDAIADAGADSRIGNGPGVTNSAFYANDNIHLAASGDYVVASLVRNALLSIINQPPRQVVPLF